MKRLLILLPILALLMWLPSCDSGGGDGGGDTGGTGGYTLADLAGTWVLSVTRMGTVETHKITIDATGKVTKYWSTACAGGAAAGVTPDVFTLNPDGKLRLVNTKLFCVAYGLDVYWVVSYKLKMTSATTLTGAIVLHQFCDILGSPTCMNVSETWPTSGVKQ